jgi:peptidoglycan LD-endopeptidase CwlK
MADRDLSHLHPKVEAMARAALAECSAAGIDVLVTCTYRTGAEQEALYARGRTKPGPKVTNARAGQSLHQYRVALDIVIMVHGKPDWSGRDSGWMKALNGVMTGRSSKKCRIFNSPTVILYPIFKRVDRYDYRAIILSCKAYQNP